MEQDEEALIIKGSRLKPFRLILYVLPFVLVGTGMILDGEPAGWFYALFFGLGIPVSLIQIIGDTYLKLDKSGFEVNPGINSWRLSWNDVDSFYIRKIYGTKYIGFDYSSSYRKLNKKRKKSLLSSGTGGAINNQFKLSAEKVCEYLNEWKSKHSSTNEA